MPTPPKLEERQPFLRRPLEYVAFWQSLGFLMLMLFVWAMRMLDISRVIPGRTAENAGTYEAWIMTFGIIVVAMIVVAHTYLMERRILRGYIIVCSYCHKVQLGHEAWQQMEAFITDRTLAEFTHGVCPHCYEQVLQDIEKTPKAPST